MPVIIGQKYTKLTPVYELSERTKSRGKIYHCVCDCGNELDVPGASLVTNNTKSCGCLQKESAKEAGERIRERNKYDLSGTYGIGWTCNTNIEFYFDIEDYDKIKDYCWYEGQLSRTYHTLETRTNNTIVKMHQIIFEKNADHKNRNTLDNRKENLRKCTTQENLWNSSLRSDNTSGYIGVSWDKENNKWSSRIDIDGKHKRLGRFTNKDDAIRARLQAEAKYFGEFAPQRHLFEEYGIGVEI